MKTAAGANGSLEKTEARRDEGSTESLDAFGGILTGVLAGTATWLALTVVALNLP